MMLTTVDNPFDPYTEYEQWNTWDQDMGYYTNSLLARVANTNDSMSTAEYDDAVHDAILSVLDNDIDLLYIVV